MKENSQPALEEPSEPQAPTVVGIGASAGGLAALKRFFERIPEDSGLVFVVVAHLSPDHKSVLADLLQPSVRFPVQQVTETVLLQKNTVYVIPPNCNLSAIDTHLRLSSLEARRSERSPIDHFFRTLAATHDGHSVGVVLTGTGSDGTLGLKEVKANGGVVLVQDPNEAEFDGMPQSAIASGIVDRVLPVAEIADALLRLAKLGEHLALQESSPAVLRLEASLLPKVLAILRTRTERDFSRYKPATIQRRIARRMQLNYIEDFAAYVEFLRAQPDEARALADDLLITVTSFFRDAAVFQKLQSDVIPKLFGGKTSTDTIRVWSVGCATGEEAYSIAMLLLEEAARMSDPPQIQIFASDLHKHSLEGAREGLYSGDIETDVSAERLSRYFRKENGGYRICKEVRDRVVFAPHNLLADPPFSRLDLITCRNLLIYLDRGVQRDVIDLFHYALCPTGYLLLGSAETTDAADLFRPEDKKLCIYQKRNVPAPEPRLPVFPLTKLQAPGTKTLVQHELTPVTRPTPEVHALLLEQLAPPSILVGPEQKLVHISEHAGRFLSLPGGEVTTSVLRLVHEDLRIELQALLQLSRQKRQPLDSRPIPLRLDGVDTLVVMRVRPAPGKDHEGFVLVIFEEQHAKPKPSRLQKDAPDKGEPHRAEELQAELDAAHQRMQTIIEEYETSREEMKAANEEMQSTNEELRSTMEELETSKEELQSINEELQTVNQENRHKVDELSQLSGDLQNLLAATEIATLFLDRDLRIMRFTPRLAKLFNIRVTDRGRPISDLTHRLGYRKLREDAEGVLESLVPMEHEIRDDDGRWYLTRILPYRSAEQRIEGVVVTFIEISAIKKAESAMRESEARYRALITAGNHPIYRMSPDWKQMYQLDGNHALSNAVKPLENWADNYLLSEDQPWIMAAIERAIKEQSLFELEHRIRLAEGGIGWVLSRAVPIFGSGHEIVEWFGSTVDITRRKEVEHALQESEARQSFLLRFSDALSELGPTPGSERPACSLLVEQLQVDRFYYVQIDDAAGLANVHWGFAREGARSLDLSHTRHFAWSIAPLREGHSQLIPDVHTSPILPVDARAAAAALGDVAYMAAPIIRRDVLLGACFVSLSRQRSWTAKEADLLQEVSGRVWEAVERARAEQEAREMEERQSFLLTVSDALRTAEPEQVQEVAMKLLGERLAVNRVLYFWVVADHDALEAGKAFVRGVPPMPTPVRLRDFADFLTDDYRAGRTTVVDDVLADPRFAPASRQAFESIQVRASIGVPMLKAGQLVAVLGVQQAAARHWSRSDTALVEDVAHRTWAAFERARVEVELRESEESQRVLLEGMPQLVWRSRAFGQWTWSSPQWQAFTGQTQEQSAGHGWLSALHPDDVGLALRAWEQAVAQGRLDVEYRIRNAATGQFRWHYTRSLPIRDARGNIVEWLGTSSDIERFKAAEAARRAVEGRFELFVRNVHEYALVQVDQAGMITLWNPGASRLFDYEAGEIIGRSFAVLLTEEEQSEELLQQELDKLRDGQRHEDARWLARRDSSRFWARWITEPVHDEAGNFVGGVKVMRDETEREQATATIRNALAEKDELLQEVHHRVKNNLQVITSLLSLQANQIEDKATLEAFDEARNRIASIAAIHELLYRSDFMAAIVLAEYARQFAPTLLRFYGADEHVEVEIAGDGMALELERAVLYGLLLNELLSNAFKHAFPGRRQGRIEISFEEQAETIVLCVHDNGIGMPKDFLVAESSSLGLKLVHRLARQLRGTVEFLDSAPGTTVVVQFPKAPSAAKRGVDPAAAI